MKSHLKFFFVSLIAAECFFAVGSSRPKGVRVELASFYNPGSDFKCLDGSNTIPFIQVNDDYCDCEVSQNPENDLI